MPTREGLLNLINSITIQTIAPMAAEICVTKIATPALVPADKADPPLKPNQPTQSMDAPIIVKTGLCGGLIEVGNFLLEPKTTAVTKAPTLAVV